MDQGYGNGYYAPEGLAAFPTYAPVEGTAEWAQQRYPSVYQPDPAYILSMEGVRQDIDYSKLNSFQRHPFNVCAFLFGVIYFFYRKMWLEGLVYLAIVVALSLLPLSSPLIDLAVWVVGGFAFYPLWRRKSHRVWDQAVYQFQGNMASVVAAVRRKGGVSVAAAIICIVALIVYITVVITMAMTSGIAAIDVGSLATMTA